MFYLARKAKNGLEINLPYPDHNHVGLQQNLCEGRFQNIQADIRHYGSNKREMN